MTGLDFVTLDFETANPDRGSPCAAGLVRFREGVEVESWYRLMRPPEAADWFHGFNICIHGITPDLVVNEPRFGDLWQGMRSFIGGDVVVAHNASFDLSVLRRALAHEGIESPNLEFACTMRAARRVLDLLSYSLPWVAAALDIRFDDHHNARADAQACGQVLVALAGVVGATTLAEFAEFVHMRMGHFGPSAEQGDVRPSGRPILPVVNTAASPAHPLYGQHVTFTGGLDSMPRQVAWDWLGSVGGIPEASMNKRTNILVVGPGFYRGEVLDGDLLTGKMAKAAALRAKGHPIEIMSEDEFLRSL